MIASKAPSLIDKHVAARMRLRRIQIGLGQEELAQALGVTCQQVQKYEKGTNRISAGRLQEMAKVLSVPIHFFYEDVPDAGEDALEGEIAILTQFASMPELVSFVRIVSGFRNPKIRRSMRDLAMAIAEELHDTSLPEEKPHTSIKLR